MHLRSSAWRDRDSSHRTHTTPTGATRRLAPAFHPATSSWPSCRAPSLVSRLHDQRGILHAAMKTSCRCTDFPHALKGLDTNSTAFAYSYFLITNIHAVDATVLSAYGQMLARTQGSELARLDEQKRQDSKRLLLTTTDLKKMTQLARLSADL
jgi:hypothetical protein